MIFFSFIFLQIKQILIVYMRVINKSNQTLLILKIVYIYIFCNIFCDGELF